MTNRSGEDTGHLMKALPRYNTTHVRLVSEYSWGWCDMVPLWAQVPLVGRRGSSRLGDHYFLVVWFNRRKRGIVWDGPVLKSNLHPSAE